MIYFGDIGLRNPWWIGAGISIQSIVATNRFSFCRQVARIWLVSAFLLFNFLNLGCQSSVKTRAVSSLQQLQKVDALEVTAPKPVLTPKLQVLAAIEKTGANIEEAKKEVSKVIEQIKEEQPEALQEISAHTEIAKQLAQPQEPSTVDTVSQVAQIDSLEPSIVSADNDVTQLNAEVKLSSEPLVRKVASHPEAQFLTGLKTHLINAEQIRKNEKKLAQNVEDFYRNRSDFKRISIVVKQGDTLQSISYRLYLTARRWPELYLLNRHIFDTWDTIEPTMVMTAYVKANSPAAKEFDRLSTGP